jgi:diguanylate cyclase (GGDEF)-like protein
VVVALRQGTRRGRPSAEPDEGVLAGLARAEKTALIVVMTIAVLTLGLWFLPPLSAVAPSIWSKMVANTTVGMLLAAIGLALSTERRSQRQLRLSEAAAFGVLVLGALTLVEYAAQASLGIDLWLPADYASQYPGRPSPQAASAFTLLGLSLLVMREHKSRRSLLADALALALAAFMLLMINGYLYGALRLVGVDSSTFMSPQTLLCFSLLAVVVVARRARHGGWLAILIDQGIGGKLLRWVLPVPVIVIPAFYGVAGYLISSTTLSTSYAYAITAATESLLATMVLVWMGWWAHSLGRQLRDLSLADELTNLYNRRGFYFLGHQAFLEASRASSELTVIFFDLDGLKRANDTLGHAAGSRLLQQFASLLVETFRASDIIGRVGGDEFAVITVRDSSHAREGLARLDRSVANLNAASGELVPLGFSVGVAEMSLGGSESLEDLVARADARMFRDKARKKLPARSAA